MSPNSEDRQNEFEEEEHHRDPDDRLHAGAAALFPPARMATVAIRCGATDGDLVSGLARSHGRRDDAGLCCDAHHRLRRHEDRARSSSRKGEPVSTAHSAPTQKPVPAKQFEANMDDAVRVDSVSDSSDDEL